MSDMLTKLIMKNFRSFKDETVIDFKRTKYEMLAEVNVADNDILKGMMFVGGNASGKSNAILAIRLLLELLFKEREINKGVLPCLFSNSAEFSLDYYFLIDNTEVRYEIKNNLAKKSIYEKLYINDTLQLERMGLAAKSYIDAGKEISYSDEDLDEETLLLRKIYFDSNRFSGNSILKKWYEFLRNCIYFNAVEHKVVTYNNTDLRLKSYVKDLGVEKLNDFFSMHNFEQMVEYSEECRGRICTIRGANDEKTLFVKRKGVDVSIPFDEESLGNKTLLQMLPAFLHVVENKGMFLIDEFSSGFHNVLEKLIISYFMKETKESQLIFVSHSTNLLSTTLLRPDQIYAVNFERKNGSQLKRFSDEQPRFAQNIEKMYLSGVFDGLPDYGRSHVDS